MRTILMMSCALFFSFTLSSQTVSRGDSKLNDNSNTITGEIRLPRAFYSNTTLTPASVGNAIQKKLSLYIGNQKITGTTASVSAVNKYVFSYSIKGAVPLLKPLKVKIGSLKHHDDYVAYFLLNPKQSINFSKKGVTHEGVDFKVKIDLKQVN